MVVKKSRKNQIAIPKVVLERAGLGPEDVYFDVGYDRGRIILTPMKLEEKIPSDAVERFEIRTLRRQRGDRIYGSMDEAIKGLRGKRRR